MAVDPKSERCPACAGVIDRKVSINFCEHCGAGLAPFKPVELSRPGFFQRLAGKLPKENLPAEINNLLASAASVRDVSHSQIAELLDRYRGGSLREFSDQLYELYGVFLDHVLADSEVTDAEHQDIVHLAELLAIPDDVAAAMWKTRAHKKFTQAVRVMTEDAELDQGEREKIDHLAAAFRIEHERKQMVVHDHSRAAVYALIRQRLNRGVLMDTERAEILALAADLGVRIDSQTDNEMAMAVWIWMADNADEVPTFETDIQLNRGEACYLVVSAKWHHLKTYTKRVQYAGVSASIPIYRPLGLRFKAGNVQVAREKTTELQLIDEGALYITSKRVIFVGNVEKFSIRMTEILDVKLYSDGLEIQKARGRSPVLVMSDVPLAAALMGRAMREGNQ